MRILLERGMVFITVVVYDLVFENRFCKHKLCKQMLKMSPKIDQHRHNFDLKSTKSCAMGLMCSQRDPKSHRGMGFCRQNGSQVNPQGSNSSPLAAKRHPKGFILMILDTQSVLPRPILTPKGHLLAFEVVSLGIQGQISSCFRFHVTVWVIF